jgi:hypothetical protein
MSTQWAQYRNVRKLLLLAVVKISLLWEVQLLKEGHLYTEELTGQLALLLLEFVLQMLKQQGFVEVKADLQIPQKVPPPRQKRYVGNFSYIHYTLNLFLN